jgi:hypothetical protein
MSQAGDVQQQMHMQMHMQMQQPPAFAPANAGWMGPGGQGFFHSASTASLPHASYSVYDHNLVSFRRAYALMGGDPFLLALPPDFRERFSRRPADQQEMWDYANIMRNKMGQLPSLI